MGWNQYPKWNSYVPGPSSLAAKWFRYRVSIHHPLGFNWHPLEVACRYSEIDKYSWIFNILIYTHERGVIIIIIIIIIIIMCVDLIFPSA